MKKIKIIVVMIISIMALGMVSVKMLNNYFETIIDLSQEEKVEEFEYLYNNLKTDFPFQLEAKALGYDIDNIYQIYLPLIKASRTDIRYFKTIGKFIDEFDGLGHLAVFDGQVYKMYSDNLHVKKDEGDQPDNFAIGHIQSVMAEEKVMRLYSELYTQRPSFINKKGQKKREEEVAESGKKSIGPSVQTKLIDSGNVAYIKIDSFLLEHYDKDEIVIDEFLQTINACSALIVDVSDNPGGSDTYWKKLIVEKLGKVPLMSTKFFLANDSNKAIKSYVEGASGKPLEAITELPIRERVDGDLLELFNSYFAVEEDIESLKVNDFHGNIFVLSGPKVYSSSDNFVQFCKNSGFATTIGQNTSGDGGLDPYLFALPNSGLIVRYSAVHGIGNDGTNTTLNGTAPDVFVQGADFVEESIEYVLDKY